MQNTRSRRSGHVEFWMGIILASLLYLAALPLVRWSVWGVARPPWWWRAAEVAFYPPVLIIESMAGAVVLALGVAVVLQVKTVLLRIELQAERVGLAYWQPGIGRRVLVLAGALGVSYATLACRHGGLRLDHASVVQGTLSAAAFTLGGVLLAAQFSSRPARPVPARLEGAE